MAAEPRLLMAFLNTPILYGSDRPTLQASNMVTPASKLHWSILDQFSIIARRDNQTGKRFTSIRDSTGNVRLKIQPPTDPVQKLLLDADLDEFNLPNGSSKNGWEPVTLANFFLIDQSLRQSGGHHFDYVRCIANAANGMGFLTSIGVNTALEKSTSVSSLGNLRRTFRKTTYQPDSYLQGLRHLTRSKSNFLIKKKPTNRIRRATNFWKKLCHGNRREKLIRHFAMDCERFFRGTMFLPGDHAFFTTVSELEFLGLVTYLARTPQTIQVNWHLQFHYNLFEGRTPEYDGQSHVANAVQKCFDAGFARVPYHSINLYTTSETLAEQYNRLGVSDFQALPYPIAAEFLNCDLDPATAILANQDNGHASVQFNSGMKAISSHSSGAESSFDFDSKSGSDSPAILNFETANNRQRNNALSNLRNSQSGRLRFTCPGAPRREKGQKSYLQSLANQIWEPFLSNGQLQLVVQRPEKNLFGKQKLEIALPATESESPFRDSAIEYNPHPLDQSGYEQLIKSTDCGLLFYDSRVYFSRRAGVLGELLACGKPVIVPAGSWLAEQIQEPGFRHVEQLLERQEVCREYELKDIAWDSSNVPLQGGIISFDQQRHPFRFELEPEIESAPNENNSLVESGLAVQMDWHWPRQRGVYCRIEFKQFNRSGKMVAEENRVVGHRDDLQATSSFFRLEPETVRTEFQFMTAFHDATASVQNLKISQLRIPHKQRHSETPWSSVGLIASDEQHLVHCIAEMVKNYDHYRDTAEAFAHHWRAQHEPKRTVAHLIAAERAAQNVA